MTRYEIRIEELVLRGVPQEQATDIAALVEERLRELAANATADQLRSGAGDAVRGRPLTVEDGPLGAAIADRVWSAVASVQGGAS